MADADRLGQIASIGQDLITTHDPLEEHLQFLKRLGAFIRRHEIGVIEEPLPEANKRQLLHMKRDERERGSDH